MGAYFSKNKSLLVEVEVGLECGLDASNIEEVNWSFSTGGTPGPRWSTKSQPWKLSDMCTWIGVKGYKSLSRIYSDILHESERHNNSLETSKTLPHADDIKELRALIVEINTKHEKLCRENEELTKCMKTMSQRIEELEVKLSSQTHTSSPVATATPSGPPPPPPPPPPMPTAVPWSVQPLKFQSRPRTTGDKQQDDNFVRRPSITPQDIKNVKLRKTKLNPLGTKAVEQPKPFITMEILKQKKMSLLKGRRPVASSTPKQLTDFEKCLLQDSTLAPPYLRRTSSFRSTEDLRAQAPLYRRTICTRNGTEFNKISPSKHFNSTISLPESGV